MLNQKNQQDLIQGIIEGQKQQQDMQKAQWEAAQANQVQRQKAIEEYKASQQEYLDRPRDRFVLPALRLADLMSGNDNSSFAKDYINTGGQVPPSKEDIAAQKVKFKKDNVSLFDSLGLGKGRGSQGSALKLSDLMKIQNDARNARTKQKGQTLKENKFTRDVLNDFDNGIEPLIKSQRKTIGQVQQLYSLIKKPGRYVDSEAFTGVLAALVKASGDAGQLSDRDITRKFSSDLSVRIDKFRLFLTSKRGQNLPKERIQSQIDEFAASIDEMNKLITEETNERFKKFKEDANLYGLPREAITSRENFVKNIKNVGKDLKNFSSSINRIRNDAGLINFASEVKNKKGKSWLKEFNKNPNTEDANQMIKMYEKWKKR